MSPGIPKGGNGIDSCRICEPGIEECLTCLLVVEVVSRNIGMFTSDEEISIRRLDSTKGDARDRTTVELCVFVSLDRQKLVCDVENYDLFGHVMLSCGPSF